MEALWQDLTLTLRGLRRSPCFTATAVLTLVLAIGVNTAMFSAVETVLLHPLPVRDLDRVASIEGDSPGLLHGSLAPGEVEDLIARQDLFEAVAGYRVNGVDLTGRGEPRRVSAVGTIGPFFDVLRVQPAAGRLYTSQDVASGHTRVAVLSYGVWRDLTGGDPRSIGSTIRLDDESFELIGVVPADFRYPDGVELWTPHPIDEFLDRSLGRSTYAVRGIGRLRPGVTLSRLNVALASIMNEWKKDYPASYEPRVQRTLVARDFVAVLAGQLRAILFLLTGAVLLVLGMACVNTASLQLVRTMGRRQEIAVRAALGASRWMNVRQQLMEAFVIAAFSGLLGVVAGDLLIRLIARSDAAQSAMLRNVRLDPLVLGFTFVVTLGAAVLFGAVPALRAANIEAGETIRSAGRGSSAGLGQSRFLRAAVVFQVAFSLVLLLGSGVALRSLGRALAVSPGFEPEGVVTMELALSRGRYKGRATNLSFHDALIERLRAIPGIVAAGAVSGGPFGYVKENEHRGSAQVAGRPQTGARRPAPDFWVVDDGYFAAMGIPLREGRAFTKADDGAGQPVTIIDESLARELFPGEDPIGKQLVTLGTVVGVVGSVKKTDLTLGDVGSAYKPLRQWPQPYITVAIRTTLPTAIAAGMLRRAVHEVDPQLPAFDIVAMPEAISRSLAPRRFGSWLLGGFAALSLLLATLGIYGVLSYTTSQRTKEIGIRLALGAQPASVVRMVLQSGAGLVGIGLLAGGLMFVLVARLVSALVFGISAHDPLTIGGATLVLVCTALMAGWLPARRAAGVDPVRALRSD